MKSLVHLGYEVGSGDTVEIPVRHMAVTGQTQESGKTTTLEALISRSGHSAIAFLTKRGEGSFSDAVRVRPYFQERTDWQFVQSIIESVLRKDQQFKQPWIMRACEGAKSLADVQKRTRQLEEKTKNAFSQDMYMVLGAYLDKVVPVIASLPKSNRVEVNRGRLSVMDLVSYPEELQILVIASTLEWIHKHEQGVITVIPEAWKFIPQGRNTPVRMAAEKLIREGAGLRNYVWIDSQDMAGVDKIMLRACAVWLIGVQREANEVKRAIANMPAGLKRPNAGDVATLELGQFFACFGSVIKKTYVQPAWMEKEIARGIALGTVDLRTAIDAMPAKLKQPVSTSFKEGRTMPPRASLPTDPEAQLLSGVEGAELESSAPFHTNNLQRDAPNEGDGAGPEMATGKEQAVPDLDVDWFNEITGEGQYSAVQEEAMPAAPDVDKLFEQWTKENRLNSQHTLPGAGWSASAMVAFGRACVEAATNNRNGSSGSAPLGAGQVVALNTIVTEVIEQIRRDPALLAEVSALQPEIVVRTRKQVVELDGSTLRGRLALMIAADFFASTVTGNAAFNELQRRGFATAKPNVYRELDKLAEMGFVLKQPEGGYQAVPAMKISRQTIEVQQ